MSKVNAFDEESVSIPSFQIIIERLKEVSKTEADAALSKWLGKTGTFIATCKNREGISLDVIIPKLNNEQLLYVLRGVRPSMPEEIELPPVRLSRVWSALGVYDPDRLANRIELSPQRAKALMSGKAQPTTAEVCLLLDEVTNTALVLSSHLPALSPDRLQRVNE
ncbi:MAG: hypothetical protein AAB214_07480 [Fibrobacterota bacterium]